MEYENVKLLWDFTVQCDNINEARKSDIITIQKEDKQRNIDIVLSGNVRVIEKQKEIW